MALAKRILREKPSGWKTFDSLGLAALLMLNVWYVTCLLKDRHQRFDFNVMPLQWWQGLRGISLKWHNISDTFSLDIRIYAYMEDGVYIYIYKSLPLSPYGSKCFLRINYHRCGTTRHLQVIICSKGTIGFPVYVSLPLDKHISKIIYYRWYIYIYIIFNML